MITIVRQNDEVVVLLGRDFRKILKEDYTAIEAEVVNGLSMVNAAISAVVEFPYLNFLQYVSKQSEY